MSSQKERAIRTCFAKILLQDKEINLDDAMTKATKWYERKQKEKTARTKQSDQLTLMYDAQNMGPVTKEQYDRIMFNENFVGPFQKYPKRSLLDIMGYNNSI